MEKQGESSQEAIAIIQAREDHGLCEVVAAGLEHMRKGGTLVRAGTFHLPNGEEDDMENFPYQLLILS